jgi:hypothetical protein
MSKKEQTFLITIGRSWLFTETVEVPAKTLEEAHKIALGMCEDIDCSNFDGAKFLGDEIIGK